MALVNKLGTKLVSNQPAFSEKLFANEFDPSKLPKIANSKHYVARDGREFVVTEPFCDKLIISGRICISDVTKSAAMAGEDPGVYLDRVAMAARKAVGDTKAKGASGEEAFKCKVKIPKFDVGHIRLGPNAASTAFSIGRKRIKGGAAYPIRIELNPNRLTPKGLAEVDDVFTGLFGEEVNFYRFLRRARTSRVDVAVDVYGISPCDLTLSADEAKWSTIQANDHALETFTLRRRRGEKFVPSVIVYDKRQEQADHGISNAFGDVAWTRIEIRLPKNSLFVRLAKLRNPFCSFGVSYLGELGLGVQGFDQFAFAVRGAGLKRALQTVPPEQREIFSTIWCQQQSASFWQPDYLWSQWRDALTRQGLGLLIENATAV